VPRVADVVEFLHEFAPLELAEDWDNVGLLIGSRQQSVSRVMTCLTLTPDVAAEAISRGDDLIVTHHPVLFRSVQRLTDESVEGQMLLELVAAGIAVYSPHTAFDSAADGINQQLAESLGLEEISALRPIVAADSHDEDDALRVVPGEGSPLGGGRFGVLPHPVSLGEFNQRVKAALGVRHLQFVGDEQRHVERVAVACGAAAEFLREAREQSCHVLLTGEARFHACLEARATGVALVLPGHYATERPAVEQLAMRIGAHFSDIVCAPSTQEHDPVQWSL
jgi:dinuclear metal center YbgI/SA1388 family protein